MGTVISFGNQKGGCGKTTTTCISAYFLAKKGYRVLVIDLDHQGNSTFFLAQQSPYNFTGRTIYEGMKERDVLPVIVEVEENLHLIPAEDALEAFDGETDYYILKQTLAPVVDRYDYILLDLPPSTGIRTRNGLTASDYVVVLLQTDPLCYEAMERFLRLMHTINDDYNSRLDIAGILPTMVDPRATVDRQIIESAQEDYDDWVFQAKISRKIRLKEFSLGGITETYTEDRIALRNYKSFLEELIARVKQKETI